MLRFGATSLLLILLTEAANAHMRFVCPRPQQPNSGFKRGVCGGQPSRFDEEYMEVTPGPMTLKLEETVFHRGAPNRIALSSLDNTDKYCVLLDQIPHNDAAKVKLLQPVCPIYNYPIGGCDTSFMYVTVNIPDIKCDRCFLHLISVMTDKYTPKQEPCVADGIKATNCSTYYTCTNIKIRPTASGAQKSLDSCQSYKSNLMGRWPYMPQDGYPMGQYGDHGISFSPLGFLRGPAFVGSSATYMMGAEPVGTCAPKQSMCAVVSTSADRRMAVGVAVLEDRLRLTAIAQGSGSSAVRLVINGQVYDFKLDASTGVLDETMLVKLSAGSLSEQIKVITTNNGSSETLPCEDTSFIRLTKPASLRAAGLAVYRLSPQENQLKFQYLVRNPENSAVSVRGPSRGNEQGPVLIQLAQAAADLTSLYGESDVKLDSSKAVHALWKGWLYLEAAGLRAQIPPFDAGMCKGTPAGICMMVTLSANGKQPVDMSQSAVDPHGIAALSISDTKLDISMSLARVASQDQLYNVTVLDLKGTALVTLPIQTQTRSALDSRLLQAEASTKTVPSGLKEKMNQGLVQLRVDSQSKLSGLVFGILLGAAAPTTPAPTSTSGGGFFCQVFGIGCF